MSNWPQHDIEGKDPELVAAYERTEQLNDTDLVPQGWYGFEQPIGWSKIVLDLHEKIVARYPDYEVHQVKQKFGGLRFYCAVAGRSYLEDEEMKQWIAEAEAQAAETCEVCGAGGAKLRPGGWIRTLCDEHAEGRPSYDDEEE